MNNIANFFNGLKRNISPEHKNIKNLVEDLKIIALKVENKSLKSSKAKQLMKQSCLKNNVSPVFVDNAFFSSGVGFNSGFNSKPKPINSKPKFNGFFKGVTLNYKKPNKKGLDSFMGKEFKSFIPVSTKKPVKNDLFKNENNFFKSSKSSVKSKGFNPFDFKAKVILPKVKSSKRVKSKPLFDFGINPVKKKKVNKKNPFDFKINMGWK